MIDWATQRSETPRDRRAPADAELAAAASTGVQAFAYDVRCWPDLLDGDALAAALFELRAFVS
ncbi:hypothetical protein MAHJHV57_40060 [Mycobacterium avium subsp. hominissuis]